METTAPAYNWAPNKRQAQFLSLPDSIFEALYGGAAGGGKSEILLFLPIVREFTNHHKFHGVIFRKNFTDLEESLILRSYSIYGPMGAKYNDTKHVWTFPSGAKLRFSYLEKDADARDHDTAEYNYLAFDELTQFSEFQYRYMTSRVRTSSSNLPAIIRSATNPGNIGHSWVRKRFVEPHKIGNVIIRDKVTNQKRIFIPAKLTDNPHLGETDPDYLNRLQILPEAERKAKIDGDWWTFSGQVFSEFREKHYQDEPDNAIHVVKPFEIPAWWPKVVAMDWGFTAKTWVGAIAVAPDSRTFLYKEYTAKKKQIEVWGADVRRMFQFDENIVEWVLDPSAWRSLGEPKTIAEQIMDAIGTQNITQADNDRLGGKMLLHEFLRFTQRPPRYVPQEGFQQSTYDYILRNSGLDIAKQYQFMFEPEPPEKNIPRLQIFSTCTEIINTIPVCVYDKARVEDVQEFDGDDPYDGIRYLVKAVDRYVRQSAKSAHKYEKIGKIVTEYERTHNTTAFYRQMEYLEAQLRKGATFGLPRNLRGTAKGKQLLKGYN